MQQQDFGFYQQVPSHEEKLTDFVIKQISYQSAMAIVIQYHYLHRACSCSYAFGLIDKIGNVRGVAVYGASPSSTLLKGICGEDEATNVYELTRLWVCDKVPKNGESYLVANSLKRLDREIIVSFADTSQGHIGTIYQACNFLYCGLSTRFVDYKVRGLEHLHHATYGNRLTNKQLIEKYGQQNVYKEERSRKHRYIFFNAKSKKRKKELLQKLKYQVLPYPKPESVPRQPPTIPRLGDR